MILSLLAAALATLPGGEPARFKACTEAIRQDPAAAVAAADAWRLATGSLAARHCLGLAYVAQERWSPAAATFEQAAAEAEARSDGRAADLWVQAGNAALAGDEAAKARGHFDRALALKVLADPMRGEAHLDRARADVELGDLAAARADLDRALALVPADPLGWLLSATLARRQGEIARAARDIAEAARLSPDDVSVAYEQGRIAQAGGRADEAKAAWERAVTLAPETPVGRAAKAALGR